MSRLDPRTRIVIIVAISAAAMFTDRIQYLLGLLAFTVAAMIAEGTGFGRIWRQLTGAVGIVAFIFVLQTLFGQFALGAMLAIRLLIIIMSALILLAGAPRDYLLAMIQCRMPYELAYMVILAFHFFPILREESQDVYYSIQLRGTELKHVSVMKKLTAFRKMCIPILASAMERAKDTSIAFVSLNSCFLMPERRSDKDYEKKLAKVEQWLEKDLKNSNAKWKFVYMHHPMYPVADDSKLYGQLRENWEVCLKSQVLMSCCTGISMHI